MGSQGIKHDKGKLPWHLLPIKPVMDIIEILAFGAEKYGENNWQNVEPFKERYYSALMRHITAWFNSEELDQESGKHHLAHAGCCLIFLLWKFNK
jgi:hypothetical protein